MARFMETEGGGMVVVGLRGGGIGLVCSGVRVSVLGDGTVLETVGVVSVPRCQRAHCRGPLHSDMVKTASVV